jgi:hypothetical protein
MIQMYGVGVTRSDIPITSQIQNAIVVPQQAVELKQVESNE